VKNAITTSTVKSGKRTIALNAGNGRRIAPAFTRRFFLLSGLRRRMRRMRMLISIMKNVAAWNAVTDANP
jgi:hypothetical protein